MCERVPSWGDNRCTSPKLEISLLCSGTSDLFKNPDVFIVIIIIRRMINN